MAGTVRVDAAKNRIYVRFEGFLNIEDAEDVRRAYGEAIAQVDKGFTVLTDARDYLPGTPEVQEIITSMTHMADRGGCAKVARVLGENPLGGYQIDRLAKESTSYPSQHFKTVEEAEEYLDAE